MRSTISTRPARAGGRRTRVMLRIAAAAVALAATMALPACGGDSDPLGGGGSCGGDTNALTVGSANFPESETVAEVYAQTLRANGFDIDTTLNIGSREAYVPALRQCAIDLIPDYTGNLLQYLDKSSTVTSPGEVNAALTAALGDRLAIGAPAPGEDSDALVVTRATADKWNLHTIADLVPHAAEVRLAAPSEFSQRPGGLPGLKKNYGLDISAAGFVPISDGGGPATVRALTGGQVNVADIFTTSPAIAAGDLVVLADPKRNFPPQNVVPLYNTGKKSDKLVAVLDAVSAKLTTAELLSLNTAVSGDRKTEPAAAAKQWVAAQGLGKPIG